MANQTIQITKGKKLFNISVSYGKKQTKGHLWTAQVEYSNSVKGYKSVKNFGITTSTKKSPTQKSIELGFYEMILGMPIPKLASFLCFTGKSKLKYAERFKSWGIPTDIKAELSEPKEVAPVVEAVTKAVTTKAIGLSKTTREEIRKLVAEETTIAINKALEKYLG